MSEYLLDKDYSSAQRRLEVQESLHDPATLSILSKIGIKSGWNCLELGGGRGSIASWMCKRVGSDGHVTVVDLETRFLKKITCPNLKIVEGNIEQFEFGQRAYDLIHARDVLVHLKDREIVLGKITASIKSGGWIFLEEPDVITDMPDPLAPENLRILYEKVTKAIYQYLIQNGLDPYFGRKLFGMLRSMNFQSLQAEGRVHMFSGGGGQEPSPHMMAFAQLKNPVVKSGLATDSEFSDFLQLARNPSFAWREGLTMSVWGQR